MEDMKTFGASLAANIVKGMTEVMNERFGNIENLWKLLARKLHLSKVFRLLLFWKIYETRSGRRRKDFVVCH